MLYQLTPEQKQEHDRKEAEREQENVKVFIEDVGKVNEKHGYQMTARIEFMKNEQGQIIGIVAVPSVVKKVEAKV